MKISIITVVWNNKETIKYAIDSVLNQTYKDIEYIIVDGASSDGTVEVVQSYGDRITKFISEPDKGLYDAMNKGIKLATGDVVGILNSDDFYIDEFVIEKIVKIFQEKKVDSVFADLVYVKPDNLGNIVRYYDSSSGFPNRFQYALYPAHPTFFVKRWAYEKYGLYKTDYKIAADFDVMARFLYTRKISFSYLKEPIIKMRVGGVSTSLSSIWINSLEQLRVCRENNIKTNIFKILLKYPIKILGFFKKR
ncbi:glycosyltransferase family 2 protein [Sulfurovum sp. XTW-4]|uniref:Glycosyltransferase family 2 protein n=1 Tax=Sulfurovum xiamenensis TaxID=3019066 RepID=A0ABT7QRI6_9BACT|nr:glycosyltransferase family 2 protein [Sulfurovum xiamenensis]MDM5263710.1 glycosyltransferase family 2 protein [Sulfurovum xiamenensis]